TWRRMTTPWVLTHRAWLHTVGVSRPVTIAGTGTAVSDRQAATVAPASDPAQNGCPCGGGPAGAPRMPVQGIDQATLAGYMTFLRSLQSLVRCREYPSPQSARQLSRRTPPPSGEWLSSLFGRSSAVPVGNRARGAQQ